MNDLMADVDRVLRRHGLNAGRVLLRPRGNAGGMSGAMLWQIEYGAERLCLRRWPSPHPTPAHLSWIHRQMQRAAQAGCAFVPVPRRQADGATWAKQSDHLWELTPWMPGKADFRERPSLSRLTAALQALARFHVATADDSAEPQGPSPGIQDRWQQLQSLAAQIGTDWPSRIDATHGAEIARLSHRILTWVSQCLPRALAVVAASRQVATRLQPCLRDVWHDHLLFDGDRVSGLVDFGAMRLESPAGDLARLIGSLVGNDAHQWEVALEAYQSVRPLNANDERLLAAFDAANIVLAGVNWIRWLFLEQRRFEDPGRIVGRLNEIESRAAQFAKQVWPFTAGL